MGWASGARLLDDVARVVMPALPFTERRRVANALIDLFEREDCDTLDEVDQIDIADAWSARLEADDGDDHAE